MMNPIGKEARVEVCRSRLGISKRAVVHARPGGEIASEGRIAADRDELARLVFGLGDGVKAFRDRGDGDRLTASTAGGASNTTKYLWDVNQRLPQLALERDGANTLLRRYVYGRRRLSMFTGGETYYYAYDGLGSVTNLTSSSGATEWTYAYEPFGALRTETQDDPGAPQNPMKFAGQLLDPTGLYDLPARTYDPQLGRFTQRDPIQPGRDLPASSSYLYAEGRPTILIDPSGARFEASDLAQSSVDNVVAPTDGTVQRQLEGVDASPKGPCHLYIGDPLFLYPDILVYGSQHCALEMVGVHALQVCLQIKKKRRFWFDTWKNFNCSSWVGSGISLRNPRAKVSTTVTAHCKKGKHEYRGKAHGQYIDKSGNMHDSDVYNLSPISQNNVTADC